MSKARAMATLAADEEEDLCFWRAVATAVGASRPYLMSGRQGREREAERYRDKKEAMNRTDTSKHNKRGNEHQKIKGSQNDIRQPQKT